MKREITALVVSGGGMECAYSAGAIYALAKKHKINHFDIVIGGSGCIGALSYYISGQYKSIKNIWNNLLNTKKVVDDLRINRIIDIDYIIDDIFRKQDVLKESKIYQSRSNYMISATNHKNGKVEWFSNKDGIDLFEAMRASMALPIVYGKVIKINGKEYCDTFNSSKAETNLLRAIELGANKILVIDNEYNGYLTEFGFDAWLMSRTPEFKKNYFKEHKKIKNPRISKSIKIFWLKPMTKLNISILDNSKKMLRETFAQGYRESLRNKQLLNFLREKI